MECFDDSRAAVDSVHATVVFKKKSLNIQSGKQRREKQNNFLTKFPKLSTAGIPPLAQKIKKKLARNIFLAVSVSLEFEVYLILVVILMTRRDSAGMPSWPSCRSQKSNPTESCIDILYMLWCTFIFIAKKILVAVSRAVGRLGALRTGSMNGCEHEHAAKPANGCRASLALGLNGGNPTTYHNNIV